MFENVLYDGVVLLAILVTVPMCAVAVLRMIGKTKRQRRPLQDISLTAATLFESAADSGDPAHLPADPSRFD